MTDPLLHVDDISVAIHGRNGVVQALSNAELTVAPGEVVALVGESGGGKSMLARTVIRSLPRGSKVTGRVVLDGREVMSMTPSELRDHRGGGAALCFQNPRRALAPLRTVGRQLTDRLQAHQGLNRDDSEAAALQLLRDVGLRDPLKRLHAYPHELSGGMAQRVMVAAALACRPKVLIADEPTTGLDVTLTREVLQLFRNIADESGRGVLLVSHDLASVASASDRIVVLYAGSVVETGPTRDVLDNPRHPYTRTLLRSVPDLDGRKVVVTPGAMPILHEVPQGCPFAERCELVDDTCRRSRPRLESVAGVDGDRTVACFHPAAPDAPDPRPIGIGPVQHGSTVPTHNAPSAEYVVDVRDAHVTYPGRIGAPGHHALRGVTFQVARGETLGIVGESGCGKSTLARMVMGLIAPSAGTVRVADYDVGDLRRGDRSGFRSTIQMVFQDPVGSLSPRRTVQQAIAEPMTAAGIPDAERVRRSRELMHRVGLDEVMLTRRPHELSGGQAQRVSVARALSVDPRVVVFDEPTSALDVTVQAQILELVEEIAEGGDRAFVFISHDLATVRTMCDRVAVLYLGKIVEIGTSDEIFSSPRHPYTRALLDSTPRISAELPTAPFQLARDLDETSAESGCSLRPRCPAATSACAAEPPLTPTSSGRQIACWHADAIEAGTHPMHPPVTTTFKEHPSA